MSSPSRKAKVIVPTVAVPAAPELASTKKFVPIKKPHISLILQPVIPAVNENYHPYESIYSSMLAFSAIPEQNGIAADPAALHNISEIEFEFENEMAESVKPLELSENFQLPLSASTAREEDAGDFAIDFSGLPGFNFS